MVCYSWIQWWNPKQFFTQQLTNYVICQEKVLKTLRQGYILKTLAEVIIGTGPHSWAIQGQWMHSPSRHVMHKCVLLLVKICNNTFQKTKIICLTSALWGPSRVLSKHKELVLEVGRPFRRVTSQFPPKVHFLSLLGVGSEPVAIPSDHGPQWAALHSWAKVVTRKGYLIFDSSFQSCNNNNNKAMLPGRSVWHDCSCCLQWWWHHHAQPLHCKSVIQGNGAEALKQGWGTERHTIHTYKSIDPRTNHEPSQRGLEFYHSHHDCDCAKVPATKPAGK